MTTGASIDPTILAVPPGGEASCELTVDNRSDIVEGYRLEVLGDAARWASVEPATLSVYPGGNATARVVFRIPRSSAVPAAEVLRMHVLRAADGMKPPCHAAPPAGCPWDQARHHLFRRSSGS